MPGMISWRVICESDPRWQMGGAGFGDCICGPSGYREWVEKCTKEYGNPPDDCEVHFNRTD